MNKELSNAVRDNDLVSVRRLLTPADLKPSESPWGLLHWAISANSEETAIYLVERGADINEPGGIGGRRPISEAASGGLLELCRTLLDAGCKIDISNGRCNPLVRAAAKGHIQIVRLLLDAGIDPHACYRRPTAVLFNALTEAEQYQHRDVVRLLKEQGCRRPIEGKDIPLWEPPPERMIDKSPAFRRYQEVIQYMEARFGEADRNGLQEAMPVVEGMSVTINIISPSEEHPYLVLFTNGMSTLPMQVPDGQERWRYAELVMHLPADWVHPRDAGTDEEWMWPLKWLRQMAYYPHINETWLGLPSAIVSTDDPPHPLGPDVAQTCLMMLPDLSNLQDPLTRADGEEVHFFTLVPLYTEERDYELQHGMEAFLDRLIEHEVPMTFDPDRPNFASDK